MKNTVLHKTLYYYSVVSTALSTVRPTGSYAWNKLAPTKETGNGRSLALQR